MICLVDPCGEEGYLFPVHLTLWGGRFMEGSLHKILSLNSPGLCPQSSASHGTVKTEAGIHLGGKCRTNETLFIPTASHFHLTLGDS